MNDNKDINNQHLCPNCKKEMEKTVRETKFFYYFKCPNCNKTYQIKKTFSTEEAIFLIGEQVQLTKEAIYGLIALVTLSFIISILFLLY